MDQDVGVDDDHGRPMFLYRVISSSVNVTPNSFDRARLATALVRISSSLGRPGCIANSSSEMTSALRLRRLRTALSFRRLCRSGGRSRSVTEAIVLAFYNHFTTTANNLLHCAT